MPAASRAQDSPAQVEQHYDIPAQPLGDALAKVATMARISIAFEPGVVANRRSSAVRGRYAPAALLRRMLEGSGLTVRFTGPRSAIVYVTHATGAPETAGPAGRAGTGPVIDLDPATVRAPRRIGQADPAPALGYARRAEQVVQTLFARSPAFQGRPFSLRVALRLDVDGRILRAELIRPTGEATLDASVSATLVGQDVGGPPPPMLVQPLRFDIAGRGPGKAGSP